MVGHCPAVRIPAALTPQMIRLYIALGMEWAIWFGCLVLSSVRVDQCAKRRQGRGYNPNSMAIAIGDCLIGSM
jgi:hypothetical protein